MAVDWTNEAAAATALRDLYGVESDLSAAALHAHARSAVAEIAARVTLGATHVRYSDGGHRYVILDSPLGTLTSVVEDGVTLVEGTDFRIRADGTVLERLELGYARKWKSRIVITYVGIAADERYDRVVADLVKLSLEYSGLDSRRDGDYAEVGAGARGGGEGGYQDEREQIISELLPVNVGLFA